MFINFKMFKIHARSVIKINESVDIIRDLYDVVELVY